MKKKLITLALCAFAVAFVSCNKDDDSGPSKAFNAEVDGEDFKAEDIEAFRDDDDIEVYADDDDGNYFLIHFNAEDIEEGESYDLEAGGEIRISYQNDDDNVFSPVNGEIKISKLSDTRLEATFEFDAEDFNGEEVEIKDGVVKVTLEKD
jgi:hypothetical protein